MIKPAFLRISLSLVLIQICLSSYSQTQMQKSAESYTCSCIDSVMTANIEKITDSLVVRCFYKGVSRTIRDNYSKNGKLKISAKKFIMVSDDLLHYMQFDLINSCEAYKSYLIQNRKDLIRFK
jgi:hypothetical protein